MRGLRGGHSVCYEYTYCEMWMSRRLGDWRLAGWLVIIKSLNFLFELGGSPVRHAYGICRSPFEHLRNKIFNGA